MLRPVLEPVLAQDILARYTRFASSVGAPAPLELLAPAAAPAPAETHVENLYQITRLVQENVLVNLQMEMCIRDSSHPGAGAVRGGVPVLFHVCGKTARPDRFHPDGDDHGHL